VHATSKDNKAHQHPARSCQTASSVAVALCVATFATTALPQTAQKSGGVGAASTALPTTPTQSTVPAAKQTAPPVNGTFSSNTPPAPPVAGSPVPQPETFGETFVRIWSEDKLTEKVLGAAAVALGVWLTKLKLKLTKVRKRLDRLSAAFSVLRSGLPIAANSRYLKVCMLGVGGAGKTTFVRTFTQCPDANPAAANAELRKFYTINEYAGPKTRFALRVDWYDFPGQNAGTITEHARSDVESDSPEGPLDDVLENRDHEPFDAVILMLDLLKPPMAGSAYESAFSNWDKARLKYCIGQCSTMALSAIKGALGGGIQYVCVFVNKLNLLANPTEVELGKIRKEVQEYVDSIAPLFRGSQIDLFIGSALGDASTDEIRRKLLQHSRELKVG
jgi:hypothetical protein